MNLLVRDHNGNTLDVDRGTYLGNERFVAEVNVERDRIAGARVDVTEWSVIVTLNLREAT